VIEEIRVIPDVPKAIVDEMCAVADTAAQAARKSLDDAKSAFAAYKEVLYAKTAAEADAALKKLNCICSSYDLPTEKPAVLTKEQSRTIFLASKNKPVPEVYKKECIAVVKRYLDDMDVARGRTAKAVNATMLIRYLITIPEFIAAYPQFHTVVLKKMNELKEEGEIPDAVVDSDFRSAVNDLLFVISA
jgi:hypothetical protein